MWTSSRIAPDTGERARLDERGSRSEAEKVLWCYANAQRLARQGIWVVCTDEIPNLQVLEREPTRRAIPGHIEQQLEFITLRHGTVNVLLFLSFTRAGWS